MTSQATTLYVAPNGSDTAPGTRARPLASLEGARDALRRLKAAGQFVEPGRVVVAGGNYTLKSPLVFGPQDGGSDRAPMRYEAATGEKPVFNGGRVLRGFKEGANGIWSLAVLEAQAGTW